MVTASERQLVLENARLREEIDQLKEQLRVAKQALLVPKLFPMKWRLTPLETRMLRFLVAREHPVHAERIIEAIYIPYGVQPASYNIVGVCIHRMRKKLKPFGIQIHNEHMVGYYLSKATRAKLRKTLNGAE